MDIEIILGKSDYSEDDFSAGMPKKSSADKQKTASQFYQLGKTAASVDRKLKDIEQAAQLGLMQKIELAAMKMALENILTQVLRRQQLMDDRLQMFLNSGSPVPSLPFAPANAQQPAQQQQPPPPIQIPMEAQQSGQDMQQETPGEAPPIALPIEGAPEGRGAEAVAPPLPQEASNSNAPPFM